MTQQRDERAARAGHPALWLPALVLVLLALPSIGRCGGFSAHGFKPDDTSWYSAIAVQNWRDFANGQTLLPGMMLWGPRGYPDGDISSLVSQPYFNKPPLAFVIHGFFLWLLGTVPAAARVPSIIAAALTVWIVTLTSARFIGRQGGVICGLALALTLEFVRHTQAFSLDLWLALWSACAAWTTVRALDRAERGHYAVQWMLPGGVFLGLSLLTKPLVGLVMVPIFLVWLILEQPKKWKRWALLCMAMMIMAVFVAMPWHLAMTRVTDGEFMAQYFGREIADRAMGGGAEASNFNEDATNPLYYVIVLVTTYWPWLLACVMGAFALFRPMDVGSRDEVKTYAQHARSLLRLGLLATLVWLILLSMFPDKRPRYLLVAYPFMAMLAGAWIEWAANSGRFVWLSDVRRAIVKWCVPAAASLGLILAIADPGKPRDKQYDELIAWLNTEYGSMSHAMNSLFIGGFSGQRAAVLYLESGLWPIPTRDNAGRQISEPDPGYSIIYHARDGLAPGPTEDIVFQSGHITVTRLRERPWEPTPIRDAGEQNRK